MNAEKMGYVVEPEKRIPVAYDAEVVVAGGGTSGLFAALAAGRMGANTVLIDRFGAIGGNIGPGYIVGGSIKNEVERFLNSNLPSISLEFSSRLDELRNRAGSKYNKYNYADMVNIASYLAIKMADEVGVELILSAYASDPIIEDNEIKGLYVEGKSGRVAVKGKVVIDATGDASIAERAGANIIKNVSTDYKSYGHLLKNCFDNFEVYDEAGLFMLIGNADWERYDKFKKENNEISNEDKAWAEKHLKGPKADVFEDAVVPFMRKAWEKGEFRAVRNLGVPDITISSNRKISYYGKEVIGGRAAIAAGQIDMGNMQHISLIEKELRIQAFETVQFLKNYIPGFENAYLMFVSPFIGSRGGPCIEGEHTLTVEDTATGKKVDDVIFRNYAKKEKIWKDWVDTGCDVPYRMLLPKGIDNVLVVGRGAAYIKRGHDSAGMMRARPIMMALGQAAGTAAALCIKDKTTPMQLNIKELQKQLIEQGFNLGDDKRLMDLGL